MKILGFEIRRSKEEKRELEYISCNSQSLPFSTVYNKYSSRNISAVFRATELISDSIAILPIKIKVTNQTHKEELENHSLNLVFENKYGLMTRYNFIKLLIQSVILRGNGFAYIDRADDGTVKALRYLESDEVNIFYKKGKEVNLYYTSPYIKGRIEPINMIHLVKNSDDGVNGISLLSYASRSINLANNTENSANNFYESGCNLSGVLTVQGQLTDKQKDAIRTSWNSAYTNGGSGLAILQGNMEYKPIQLSASDSQLLESRSYNVQDIARFFGINPVLLGDLSHSSYSTLEAAQQEFLLHTLQPYITMVEEEFTRKLTKPSEGNIEINLDETAILKTNKDALANYYATLLQNGILCPNEVRKELGLSPIEGGDIHTIAYSDVNQNTINNDGKGN